jgi:hypothetical protein
MPRGGGLNEPTISDVPRPTVTLPPPRRVRHGETTAAAETERKRFGFVPFLIVILLAAVLLVVVGPRIPWQSITAPPPRSNATQAGLPKTPPETPPAPSVFSPPVSAPPRVAPPVSEDAKPSPLGPAPRTPPAKTAEPPARRLPARATATAQEVLVLSSPAGATATLDGNSTACTTPCSLNAAPGSHTIAITMPGYQVEHRYIDVGSSPLELPPVVLRAPGGTLMLTSVPPGASVLVNGRRIEQLTPVQIPLAAGSYIITLDKDGRQVSEEVEIRNGINYRKIPIGQ